MNSCMTEMREIIGELKEKKNGERDGWFGN